MTPGYWRSRDGFWMEAIARLKPGVSLAQARAEMDVIGARLAHDYPEANAQSGLRLVSFDDSRLNDANRHVEWMIMGLAGFVLLAIQFILMGLLGEMIAHQNARTEYPVRRRFNLD